MHAGSTPPWELLAPRASVGEGTTSRSPRCWVVTSIVPSCFTTPRSRSPRWHDDFRRRSSACMHTMTCSARLLGERPRGFFEERNHRRQQLPRSLMPRLLRREVVIVGSHDLHDVGYLSPYEERLRAIATPARSSVRFEPFCTRDRLPAMLQSADIFVLPSVWDEPAGLALLEGMATGLASIASRRGGIPELGGDSVLYMDPENVQEFTETLEGVLLDDVERSQRGRRARARAAARLVVPGGESPHVVGVLSASKLGSRTLTTPFGCPRR